MEKSFQIPLSTALADVGISLMTVPIVASKDMAANWLMTNLSSEIESIYIVGWKESENPFVITFPHLIEKISVNRNALFIIQDVLTFSSYIGEINSYKHLNNYYLMLGDFAMDITSHDTMTTTFPELVRMWPSPLDLTVELIYNHKLSMISGKHLHNYQQKFVEWRKFDHDSYSPEENPQKILGAINVFLDEAVPSLESQTVDMAFRRSPKFRDLITNLLFHNKKRHYINMVGGELGLVAFESLYNRLDIKNLPLHVIRSEEPHQLKKSKIDGINSSNGPIVVVSDFHFVRELSLKNIDYYHITSGGSVKDFLSLLCMVRGINYTGSYPRKFHINNYITETPQGDVPLDAIYAKKFQGRMEASSSMMNDFRTVDPKIIFIEDDLFLSHVEG